MQRCVALFQHGWADWEAGFVLAALREHFGFTVEIATPGGAEVTSIGGVRARADDSFEAVDPERLQVLLVIGSDAWARGEDSAVSSLLRRAEERDVVIGAICAGTVAAARAGLLDGRAHTSNEPGFLQRSAPAYAGEAHYVDTPGAVTAGRVVTASGMAPKSFAIAILRLAAADQGVLIDQYEALLRREHASAVA